MTFRIKSVEFESRHLEFSNNQNDGNLFTIIIGKNGIGKSRLLREIANTYLLIDQDKTQIRDYQPNAVSRRGFVLKHELNGIANDLFLYNRIVYTNSSLKEKPSKVICTSNSPFDKFPLDRRRQGNWINEFEYEDFVKNQSYVYLGSKNTFGQSSISVQIKRFIESLMFSYEKSSQEIRQLANIFHFLLYKPFLKIDYGFRDNGLYEQLKSSMGKKGDWLKHSISENISYINKIAPTSGKEEKKVDEKTINRLVKATKNILEFLGDNKQVTFELDFNKLDHNSNTVHLFTQVQILSKFGFLKLKDLFLYKEDKTQIKINDASSGEKCVLMTLLGIASEISDDSLICIDEPEISLHPEWQEKFIELLTETFSRVSGCHFILATHSPQILARVKSEDSNVLLMDEGKLYPASDYTKRSADFQLVEAFQTPGYKNEYLAREAMTVYTNFQSNGKINPEYRKQYEMLKDIYSALKENDPVAKLIKAIVELQEDSPND